MFTMQETWLEWLRREEENEAIDAEMEAFDQLMRDAEEHGGEG